MKKTLLLLAAIIISYAGMAQWQQTNLPTSQTYVNGFCENNSKLYAAASGGILRSTDNGSSWAVLVSVPNFSPMVSYGNYIYAGSIGNVLRSTNNGINWYGSSNGINSNASVKFLANSGSNIFAGSTLGLYLSTNYGTNWVLKDNGLPDYNIRALGINGNNIFISCYGIYLSTNNGDNWVMANNGMPNATAYSFGFSGNHTFVGTVANGIYASTDNGNNWYQASSGLPNLPIISIVDYGVNIFAGINDINGGVYLSTNNGGNWADVSTGLTNKKIEKLFINGTNLLASTESSGAIFKRPLSEMTGIKEIRNNIDFSLYPNPAKDNITIETPQSISASNLTIFNLQGQILLQQPLQQNSTQINITQLPDGVYFAQIQLKDGTTTQKKFIIVK